MPLQHTHSDDSAMQRAAALRAQRVATRKRAHAASVWRSLPVFTLGMALLWAAAVPLLDAWLGGDDGLFRSLANGAAAGTGAGLALHPLVGWWHGRRAG